MEYNGVVCNYKGGLVLFIKNGDVVESGFALKPMDMYKDMKRGTFSIVRAKLIDSRISKAKPCEYFEEYENIIHMVSSIQEIKRLHFDEDFDDEDELLSEALSYIFPKDLLWVELNEN